MAGSGRVSQQQRVLELDLLGMKVPQIVAETGIKERTVRRIRAEPEYKRALSEAVGERRARAGRRLDALLEPALGKLVELLNSSSQRVQHDTVRLILDMQLRLRHTELSEAEVAELRELLDSLAAEQERLKLRVLPGGAA